MIVSSLAEKDSLKIEDEMSDFMLQGIARILKPQRVAFLCRERMDILVQRHGEKEAIRMFENAKASAIARWNLPFFRR